jgi:hypothetical protein
MRCTEDHERNKRRLHWIHGEVSCLGGDDLFSIVLQTATHRIEVDFPNHSTTYSEELVNKLRKRDGVDVRVLAQE